jgi:cytochrome P450
MNEMSPVTAAAPAIDPFDVTRSELYSEDRWQEPFRKLRAESPIHYVADSKFGPYWSVTTHKPIIYIESLPKIFSSSWEYGGITVAFDPEKLMEGEIRMPMFIAMDPPHHTAQRRTVAPSFGPSEVAAMKAEVQAAHRPNCSIRCRLARRFDWVEKVSIELTTGMLAKLFDFPWAERHKLTLVRPCGDIE